MLHTSSIEITRSCTNRSCASIDRVTQSWKIWDTDQADDIHHAVDSIRSSLPEKLSGIFMSIFDFISESTSAIAYNESFLSRYSDDGSRIHAALRVRRSISPDTQAQNERDLLNTLDLDGLPLEEARQGLVMFREWKGGDGQSEVIDEYERKARARWPHSTVFDRDALWDRPQWNIINSV